MRIYTVGQITEADYGCEDTGRREATALVKLISGEEEIYRELSEKELERLGIREGKRVIFTEGGGILRYVRVVAAVIRDEAGRVFATARGYGDYKGWWEFPGGKIEAGETAQEALAREIREELTAGIEVGELIKTVEYDYPEFHLSMDCFWATVSSGRLELKEAEAARWLTGEERGDVKWLPADLELVDVIKDRM